MIKPAKAALLAVAAVLTTIPLVLAASPPTEWYLLNFRIGQCQNTKILPPQLRSPQSWINMLRINNAYGSQEIQRDDEGKIVSVMIADNQPTGSMAQMFFPSMQLCEVYRIVAVAKGILPAKPKELE
jgi:hypothetical protein